MDPPPAYSSVPATGDLLVPSGLPAETQQPSSPSRAAPVTPYLNNKDAVDDAYSFLRSFDTVFLIDDSGSMAGSRWREAAEALATITPICTSHDADGIDIYFLNSEDKESYHGIQRASTIREIFDSVRPGGGTPTGQRLRSILQPYIRQYEANPHATKPMNLICITDGDAHDDVESPIIDAAKKLDALEAPAWQIGIQFFQIGNDPEATELLKYLDDELTSASGACPRDIVDTVPYRGQEGGTLTGDGVLKVVLGSVNRRLDRGRAKVLHNTA